MLVYLARRVGVAFVVLIAVTFLTFVMLHLLADPVREIVGRSATPDQVAAKRAELGLNDPIVSRYGSWLADASRGNLGTSWFTGIPVTETIGSALPVTVSVALLATATSAALGVLAGMAAAFRRGWIDKALQTATGVAFSVPALWVALLLVIVFAIRLHWLPATGYTPFAQSPLGWARSLVLPVIALSLSPVAAIANQTRSDVATIMQQDFFRTLRSRGLPRRRLLFRHLLRNAAPKTLTIVGLQFIALFGGTLVVEEIFAMPGLGIVTGSSALRADVPVVLGVVLVSTLLVVAVNLFVDLAVGWLDPKERQH
ncbi:ABC transporter permease [Actinomadura rayongensis]|uniref:ABC transporter permease subunit n=1 Tax=Actinomadura rayongensis TaxID=1429076 RepID=A0A6I4WLM9_9ACTN|nr:ABC transporter permease [Actinomadura rayongensis]MXQ67532.1 ABC transporter permease subunit [Actinomadura rayongensis]